MFVPLIVSNLIVIQHLQARHESFGNALAGSLRIATGIAVTLLPLSIARELVGRGSLLHDAGTLLGEWAGWAEMSVFRVDMGFLLAMLPPGAFISFGLLLARAQLVRTPSLMNKKKVAAIFARLKALNPKPTTELEYSTPFELLVAVILSAQATDKSVNLATRTLVQARQYAAGDRQARRRGSV